MEEEELTLPDTSDSAFNAADWQMGAFRRNFSNVGNDSFAGANIELLRSLQERRDDFDFPSNVASTSSPQMASLDISEIELDDLIERLTQIAAFQAAREPTGFGADKVEPEWEWPTEPAPPEAPALGSPQWPSQTQQPTPPVTWEEYWNNVREDKLANEDTGGLVDHVILTHSGVIN